MAQQGYSTSELLVWFAGRLDLFGYKAAPCGACPREGDISITVLHGLLIRAVNELRRSACAGTLDQNECVPTTLLEEWAHEAVADGRSHVYRDRQMLARELMERRRQVSV